MFQTVFSILFIAALIVGAIAVNLQTHPVTKESSVYKKVMGSIGFMSVDDRNKKSTQEFSVNVANGITDIREKMKIVSDQHDKMLAQVKEQQQILEAQQQNLHDLMAAMHDNSDLMHTKDVVSALEDQQRILTNSGHDIEALNEQMKTQMQNMKDQADMAALAREHDAFVQKTTDYNSQAQSVNSGLGSVADRLLTSYSGPDKPVLQNRMQDLLTRQHDIMQNMHEQIATKIADARQRSQDQQQALKDRIANQLERTRENH